MLKQTVKVTYESGLHARPAAEFTQIASSINSQVYLEKEGKKVNAKSILGVLSLAIGQGTKISIMTPGNSPEEEEGINKLISFIKNLKDL